MIRNKKAMLFCSQMILTGALMTGAPCLVFGDNTQTPEISQISDHSGEGQIHKPEHLEAPDFTSDPNFIDDSTDNTAGYYTILGNTTVSLDQMKFAWSGISVCHPQRRRGRDDRGFLYDYSRGGECRRHPRGSCI